MLFTTCERNTFATAVPVLPMEIEIRPIFYPFVVFLFGESSLSKRDELEVAWAVA